MYLVAQAWSLVVFAALVIAVVLAVRANARSRRLDDEVRRLDAELLRVSWDLQRLAGPQAGVGPPRPGAAVRAPMPPPPPATPPDNTTATPAPFVAQERVQAPRDLGPAQVPVFASTAEPTGDETASLEERIGLTWITRLGAAAVVLGAAYFFKIAVERGWLGPWGRVLLGVLVGIGLIAGAERLSERTDRRYVQALLGVGLAVLYVATYAAYGFYQLVPLPVAFTGLAVVALFGGALAFRHRAEVILVIALAAALANPVLLSTGKDRALALFAYLLVMTTAMLVVSVLRGFRFVPWLGLAGSAMLFLAWYAQFFVASPPAADAVTGAQLAATAGPYWPLAARLVPLGAVAGFALQWLGLGVVARRREAAGIEPRWAFLVGLIVFHCGAAAILANRPLALAIAMVVGGAIAVAVMWAREDRTWLAIPLALSFVILAIAREFGSADATAVVLVAGAWLAVYLVSLASAARDPVTGAVSTLSRTIIAAAMSAAFGLAALWLLPVHVTGLALAAAVLAGATVALAVAGRAGWLPGPAAAVTAVGLILAAAPRQPLGPEFLALSAVCAAIYLVSSVYFMFARGDVSNGVILLAAGAPLGFVAVAVSATALSAYGLRAVLSALAGLAAFGVGAAVLRRVPEGRTASLVLLTTGLGLAALAVGLAFSGVTITLVWSLMALAVVLAAEREGDAGFLTVALMLFAVALVRLLVVDVPEPVNASRLFAATLGARGALVPEPFLNARALGLFGVGLTMLLAARVVVRRSDWGETARGLPVGLAALGYLLLLAFAVTEALGLVTQLPAVPAGLSREAFGVAMRAARHAMAEQASRRAAAATLTLGMCGGGLLVAGFAARSIFHRWAGLVVLAATVVKLGMWDIWSLPSTLRVIVLLGIGGLLLAVGFLYAKFGSRLLGLLKVSGVALLLVVPVTVDGAVDQWRYRNEAVIDHVSTGLSRLEVTPDLYRGSCEPGSLADLRLAVNGAEVPWVLRDVPAPGPGPSRVATLFDPVVLPGGAFRADFDAGTDPHAEIDLSLESKGNFMRTVGVEVSDDRTTWGALASGTVFRVTIGNVTSADTRVRYPMSRLRWLRVTIAGVTGEEPVRITSGTLGPGAPADAPVGGIDLGRPLRGRARSGFGTVFTSQGVGPGVPLEALVADVATPRFERSVRVEGANADGVFAWAGDGVLLRAGSVENLRIPVHGAWSQWRVVVHDGDDPPLDIRALRGEYRLQEIVFDAPQSGEMRLLIGMEGARAPSYDLGATLARRGLGPLPGAVAGRLHANPAFDRGAHELQAPAWSERYRNVIGGALAVVLLALGVSAFRMLRS